MSEDRGTQRAPGVPGIRKEAPSESTHVPESEARKGGVPLGGGTQGRTPAPAPPGPAPTGNTPGRKTGESGYGRGAPLLAQEECEKLEQRMRQALTGFVDEPREAVAEADQVLEDLTARFTEAVARRRRTVRGAWQQAEGDRRPASASASGDSAATGSASGSGDTEQLRLAMRDYRELCERLLHV